MLYAVRGREALSEFPMKVWVGAQLSWLIVISLFPALERPERKKDELRAVIPEQRAARSALRTYSQSLRT